MNIFAFGQTTGWKERSIALLIGCKKWITAVPLAVMGLALASPAHASEAINLPPFGPAEHTILWVVLASAVIAIVFGLALRAKTIAQSPGTPEMQDVGKAIQSGAYAYLRRQIQTMIFFVIGIAIGLYLMYNPIYSAEGKPVLAIGIAVAFLMGVAASYVAGLVGMDMAVRGNMRTANKALTTFKGALETAFQAGAVSGMMTVGLGLLGAIIIFFSFQQDAMKVLIGFGFGGSLAALFMRVGGGIFTKAADVGADLVGKVEAGIPEDDPRNAAVIADNVGDNVGDCAGMAADVFESYEVTLVAAIILGAATAPLFVANPAMVMKLIMFALLIRGVGVIASILGILAVRGADREDLDPMQPINTGFWVSSGIAVLGFFLLSMFYMNDIAVTKDGANTPVEWWRFFAATTFGIILAVLIEKLTEYFTSTEKRPVTEIAFQAKTGPATMIIAGFATGLESSVWGVVSICIALLAPLFIFPPALFGGDTVLSFYGIALTGLGLLTTTGYILAMDTFGPISDNANGIFEMSGALETEEAKKETASGLSGDRIVARLDAVGNTTKALTKGFAIATAVVAAVALFHSFVQDANLYDAAIAHKGLPIDVPEIFIGLLIGGAAPYLFSAFSIKAVGRAAFLLIEEVRRQFREHPGIMDRTEKPDYARCVEISTAAAQKELLSPGILAIALPVLVGFGMGFSDPVAGAQALGGYLAGAILSGQLMAVLLSNSGGAWDNAKKKIEDGLFGGKGTDAHKAGVICDTVGDPFKDTAGPALNPLIKVMNLVALLVAPIVIQDISTPVRAIVVIMCIILLAIAVMFSKRGGLTAEEIAGSSASELYKQSS